MKKYVGIAFLAAILLAVYYEGGIPKRQAESVLPPPPSSAQVTFIELGSVTCIPGRAMQPAMRDLEKKFGDQIRILSYDIVQKSRERRTTSGLCLRRFFWTRTGKSFTDMKVSFL